MEIKTVSLIGLGALGVLFAHQLSKKLPREALRIIADSERIARYQRDGITSNGERCDFSYAAPDEAVKPADLLMVAVKSTGLDAAVRAVKNHVGPETVILSLLNGISSEEIIGRTYGMEHMLLCVSQGMDAVKVGGTLTYQNRGFLVFGDLMPDTVSEKVAAVDRFFTQTGIAHEVRRDMKRYQWSKFMLNAGCNQATAVYRCGYGGLQQGPIRETMIDAMKEVIALADKEGVQLTRDDIGYWLKVIDGLNPQGKPSMQQDIEAGRLSESAMFGGAILELCGKHGIEAPVNRLLYEKIRAVERTYRPT